MQRRTILNIIGIGVLAISLRLYKLSAQALFLDESISWIRSQLPLRDLLGILNYKNHVPLYFILLKVYLKLAPHTETGLRFFSVIFSLLSLALLMWLTNRYWGVQASLFAGWLMAVSSFEIYYAQETRMYTLLSFLWLVSLGLLLAVVSGKPKLLIPWAINLVLISYVQATGLILAFVHSTVIGGIWIFGKFQQKKGASPSGTKLGPIEGSISQISVMLHQNNKWVLIAGGIVALGVLPIVWTLLFTETWRGIGGGVWVPRMQDFPILFNLASVGLTAGRQAYLDSNHLVFPLLKPLPTWGWFLVGMITGGLAIMGSIWAWKTDLKKRMLVSIILVSMIAPPIVVWLLGRLLNQYTWAYKSFLEIILLFYMLVGIGFSRLRNIWLRRSLFGLTFGIALLSLIPYFTVWQKADTRDAFLGIPQDTHTRYVLLEKAYLSPLVHFYMGVDANLIGLVHTPEDEKVFYDIEFGLGELYGYKSIACKQVRQDNPEKIWIYGNGEVVRQKLADRPGCFGEAELWIFQEGVWIPFEF